MSSDEAFLGTVGLRTLDGEVVSDRYLESLAGSFLWPAISGIGYRLGGESGARFIALLFAIIAILALSSATRHLFGIQAAVWTALTLAISAPFIVVGHAALMESAAVAALSVGIWGIAQLSATDHRKWLAVVVLALAIATLAEYRAGFAIMPMSLLVLAIRGKHGHLDLALLWLAVTLVIVVYFDTFSDQIATALTADGVLRPYSGTLDYADIRTKAMLVVLWGVVPVAIGLMCWWRSTALRRVIGALLVGPVVWLAIMLLMVDIEHSLIFPDLALGVLFAMPAVGLAMSSITRSWPKRSAALGALCVVLAIGVIQASAFNRSWADYTTLNMVLASKVQSGELILANNRWPVALALYDSGSIDSPDDVVDEEALLGSEEVFDFCEVSWLVSETTITPWSPFVEEAFGSCPNVESFHSQQEEVIRLTGVVSHRGTDGQISISYNGDPFEGPPS